MTKPIKQSEEMVNKFAALGDANRFKIMQILYGHDDICVSEVAEQVGISTAGVSQHMHILENAGLITKTRQGQKICYRVDEDKNENSEIINMVIKKG